MLQEGDGKRKERKSLFIYYARGKYFHIAEA